MPKHDVIIEVLTGASAGGMTAAITSCAVQKAFLYIGVENYNFRPPPKTSCMMPG